MDTIRKSKTSLLSILGMLGIAACISFAIDPPLDKGLNDIPGDTHLGEWVQAISSNQVSESVYATNGNLVVNGMEYPVGGGGGSEEEIVALSNRVNAIESAGYVATNEYGTIEGSLSVGDSLSAGQILANGISVSYDISAGNEVSAVTVIAPFGNFSELSIVADEGTGGNGSLLVNGTNVMERIDEIASSGGDLTPATNYVDAATNKLRSKMDLVVYTNAFTAWTIFRDGIDVTSQVGQPQWRPTAEAPYWDCSACAISGDFITYGDFPPNPPYDYFALSLGTMETESTGGEPEPHYYTFSRSTYGLPSLDRLAKLSDMSGFISQTGGVIKSEAPNYKTDLSIPGGIILKYDDFSARISIGVTNLNDAPYSLDLLWNTIAVEDMDYKKQTLPQFIGAMVTNITMNTSRTASRSISSHQEQSSSVQIDSPFSVSPNSVNFFDTCIFSNGSIRVEAFSPEVLKALKAALNALP